jgi:hypothetical protein
LVNGSWYTLTMIFEPAPDGTAETFMAIFTKTGQEYVGVFNGIEPVWSLEYTSSTAPSPLSCLGDRR